MDVFKKFKKGILISIIIIVGMYHLYLDDELNPEAKKWIEYYSSPVNLEGNAFIGLIALSVVNDVSTADAIKLYKAKLNEITQGSLEHEQQLRYPNISGLPVIYEVPYFCKFNEENCLNETANNRGELEKIINEFSNVTKQYRALSTLTNFTPLSPIATEPDWDQFAPIHKLAMLEVYFHLLDRDLELAATQLSQLILLDRSLLRTASDAFFHVIPIVNFEMSYQPLLIELKKAGFSNWKIFGNGLSLLTLEDISMNRMWLTMFAQGTRALQFKYMIERAGILSSPLHRLKAKFIYKENMTFNSMYEYQKVQLIPERTKKESLISLVELSDEYSKKQSEDARKELDNLIFLAIKNYRNITGAIMQATAMPRFINLYEEKFSMDLRLLLLNMMLDESKKSIAKLIKEEKYRNPYTGEMPEIKNSKICYKLPKSEVCIEKSVMDI